MAQQPSNRPIPLPKPTLDGATSLEAALRSRRSVRDFRRSRLELPELSQLLWAAQGQTRRDGSRTVPSAGALYPLEVFAVVGGVDDLAPGVYRYDPAKHELLLTADGDRRTALATAALRQHWMADAPITLALAAVYRRTTQKYGDDGRSYVHMEVGHAAQNVYLQAVALGLGTTLVGAFHDERVAEVLELPKGHAPLGLLPVGKPR